MLLVVVFVLESKDLKCAVSARRTLTLPTTYQNKTKPNSVRKGIKVRHRVFTIFMGNPQFLDGKSNGSRHSVWGTSENMGCDLRDAIFALFSVCSADLDSRSFSYQVKIYIFFLFLHTISIRLVFVNGKHP